MFALSTRRLKLKRITWLMLSLLWAGLSLLLNISAANAQTCSFPMDVSTEAELNAAIACSNAETTGEHTINFTDNISLTQATTFINNSSGASLTIAGNSYIIDGQARGNGSTPSRRIFYIQAGVVTISNLTMQNTFTYSLDLVPNCGACGGAIAVLDDANVTINDSTLRWNGADNSGGAIYSSGTMSINRTLIHENEALLGSAIYYDAGNNNGTLTISNSTITDNLGIYIVEHGDPTGSGIWVIDGSVVISNSTIADNDTINTPDDVQTLTQNDGIVNVNGSVTINNSILTSQNGWTCYAPSGAPFYITNSLTDDSSCTGATLSGSINLGPLQDNGGPTLTHALETGSAAINTGDDATCTATDQRSVIRPQSTQCDIGAFEATVPVFTSDSAVDAIENSTAVANVEASDLKDSEGDGLTYSISAGDDQSFFAIDATTGVLAFSQAQDFETPGDANRDNIYQVEVMVTSSAGLTATQGLSVSIMDELECPDFPFSAGASTELELAFACYNIAPGGDYTVNITQDITLASGLTAINHSGSGELIINGAGFAIDGTGGEFNWTLFAILDGNVTLKNLTLSNGQPASGCPNGNGSACGGAVRVETDAEVTIIEGTLDGNRAMSGGAVFNAGTTTIINSTISNNIAEDVGFGGGDGGAIANVGTLIMSDSYIVGNSADDYGGAIYSSDGTISLTNVTVASNSSATEGGGIYNDGGVVSLTNATVSGNSSETGGGGIYNYDNTVNLIHTTITNNSAPNGAGISSYGDSVTFTTLAASIVAGNVVSATGGAELELIDDTINSFSSDGNNIVGSLGAAVTMNGIGDVTDVTEPELAPLADNDGATWTHALLSGSPAVDAAGVTCSVETDQRGVSRPQGSACDAGAFEIEGSSVLGDVDCSDTLGLADALMILQYNVGSRTDSGGCPLGDAAGEINLANGDVNSSGSVGLADALLIMQCNVGTNNVLCPISVAAARTSPEGRQGDSDTIFVPLMVNDGMESPVSR